ncbi:MAG: hypothetical protein H6739_04315 [Alphaproteobacteria bacterium]|nr:hypothetical protein [Alphaproteobacteria bacterium]
MTALIPALLLLLAAEARSAPEPSPAPPEDAPAAPEPGPRAAPATPKQRLDLAVRHYVAGERTAARNELLVLVNDPSLEDEALRTEARLWLGEIQYVMGELQAAESTFEAVLFEHPETRLDPFTHPPDVIAFFDAVRASVQVRTPKPVIPPPLPVLPIRPPPSKLTIAVPGGLQFYNDQPALGVFTVASVAGLGVTTLGMRLWLQAQDEIPGERGIQIYDDPLRVQRLRTVRAVENTLGFTALGIWGTAVLQGAIRVGTRPQGADPPVTAQVLWTGTF